MTKTEGFLLLTLLIATILGVFMNSWHGGFLSGTALCSIFSGVWKE